MKNLTITLVLILFSSYSIAGRKILYFGDSQSQGVFGTMMAHELEKSDSRCIGEDDGESNEVYLFARDSSSPRHWGDDRYTARNGEWLCGKTWKSYSTGVGVKKHKGSETCARAKKKNVSVIAYLVEDINPDKVVFQFLGNSMLYMKQAWKKETEEERQDYLDEHFLPKLRGIIDPIGDKECLFIVSNPNHVSKKTRNTWRFRLQAVIKGYLNAYYPKCDVIEGMSEETMQSIASDASSYLVDKLHLSGKGARAFADHVSGQMCENVRERNTAGLINSFQTLASLLGGCTGQLPVRAE